MIYADNAATTQLAPEALTAMMPFLQAEYGNASQPYAFARAAKKALKEARETIAACINEFPSEIALRSYIHYERWNKAQNPIFVPTPVSAH